ncbi:leucyl/phenylalanyl-tRNA--protein transferase [Sulfitobacter sp. S190]|uniref:leucyl/phenylalanyl-tRNA--protein transferase n=1 Tax=Sulfitobacter sp. S190 TaxID=2867022 RepID=UPI0021A79DB3|nr:leucyl/phenylalanyl-tRNA--protein transferase [Sulfitobacter sp. S190]UWR21084.1 leucyl/phenylalanyl-tRNA--protein transferase [Sulfitobacter sp. S190]
MGEITPELLLHGYSVGIFPMAESRDDPEIFWVDPRQRGILPLDGFHLSRSLRRAMRHSTRRFTTDRDFAGVLAGCANRRDTWINEEIRDLYLALHANGHAHSAEVWEDGRLVGGVYGVVLGAAFFGESMFSGATNGSKMALCCLVDHLNSGGFTLFDTQFLTAHLATLGAIEIPRAQYQAKLAHAKARTGIFRQADYTGFQDVVQRMTQMS